MCGLWTDRRNLGVFRASLCILGLGAVRVEASFAGFPFNVDSRGLLARDIGNAESGGSWDVLLALVLFFFSFFLCVIVNCLQCSLDL